MEQRVDILDDLMKELARAQVQLDIAMKESFARQDALIAKMERENAEMKKNMDADTRAMKEDTKAMKEDTKRLKEGTQAFQESTEAMKREMKEDAKRMKESTEAMKREMKEDAKRMKESTETMKREMQADTKRMKESSEAIERKMQADTERMKEDTRAMKKAWGDLANKMGTVAEDVVAPNIPRLAVEEFGLGEVEDLMVRARRASRRGEKRRVEWDVVCSGPDKVIVVEVKSTPTLDKIREVPERLATFFDFFPEYDGRTLIGVFASWSIPSELLPEISKCGLYGIAMGEETMDIVARPA